MSAPEQESSWVDDAVLHVTGKDRYWRIVICATLRAGAEDTVHVGREWSNKWVEVGDGNQSTARDFRNLTK